MIVDTRGEEFKITDGEDVSNDNIVLMRRVNQLLKAVEALTERVEALENGYILSQKQAVGDKL